MSGVRGINTLGTDPLAALDAPEQPREHPDVSRVDWSLEISITVHRACMNRFAFGLGQMVCPADQIPPGSCILCACGGETVSRVTLGVE